MARKQTRVVVERYDTLDEEWAPLDDGVEHKDSAAARKHIRDRGVAGSYRLVRVLDTLEVEVLSVQQVTLTSAPEKAEVPNG